MKKLIILLCLSQYAFGQTNTFPSTGNVGIGTTGPISPLHISNVGNDILKVQSTTGGVGNSAGIDFCTFSTLTSKVARIAAIDQGAYNGDLVFYTDGDNLNNSNVVERFRVTHGGDVGIGTNSPDSKLSVKGTIHAQEVKVDLNGSVAPDYVFESDYPLTSLDELKSYIKQNKHLPEVPSAKTMEEEGINLKEMNLMLPRKIEEITLHLIELKEENERQNSIIKELKTNK